MYYFSRLENLTIHYPEKAHWTFLFRNFQTYLAIGHPLLFPLHMFISVRKAYIKMQFGKYYVGTVARVFPFYIWRGFHFAVASPQCPPGAGGVVLVMSLFLQVLHHVGSGSGNEHGRSPGRTCRNRENRDDERYGTMSWEVCCGFQLF